MCSKAFYFLKRCQRLARRIPNSFARGAAFRKTVLISVAKSDKVMLFCYAVQQSLLSLALLRLYLFQKNLLYIFIKRPADPMTQPLEKKIDDPTPFLWLLRSKNDYFVGGGIGSCFAAKTITLSVEAQEASTKQPFKFNNKALYLQILEKSFPQQGRGSQRSLQQDPLQVWDTWKLKEFFGVEEQKGFLSEKEPKKKGFFSQKILMKFIIDLMALLSRD